MNFSETLAEYIARERIESVKRIRAHAVLRCARLQISECAVIEAFADKAAELRDAGHDPEPCLLLAHLAIGESACATQ